ncbi:MAG: peptide ABC transporter substrate-binding protein [Gemmatimonadaceae bacterium]|nr:peptide ABC transporter substrate-binding protein [Gemmatimonadaceae bacterium]
MMRPLRAACLVSLLASLCASLSACAKPDVESTPTGGTIIIATAGDASHLIPTHWESTSDRMLAELLFDPLVEIGPERNVFGDAGFVRRLASQWAWTADSLAIRFTLDSTAAWHDGQPVVARDAVAAFRVLKGRFNPGSLKTEMKEIDSVAAPDDRTVVVHFSRKSPYQLYFASHILPIPTHITDAIADSLLERSAWAQRPVGSGPYRLARREPGVETELVAVADHYRGRPGPDRILFSTSPTAESGVARVLSGEADMWELLAPQFVPEAEKYPDVRLIRSESFGYAFAAFNFRDPNDSSRPHPLLRERALRRALTMAIDRERNVRTRFGSEARAGLGPFARINSPADSDLTHIPYDTIAADRVLDSLGWTARNRDGIRVRNGRPLMFTALVPEASGGRRAMAELMQEQFRNVGVDLRIVIGDDKVFGSRLKSGRFDLLFGGWGTTPLRTSIQGTWGSRGPDPWGAQNQAYYANAEADSAIARAVRELTPAEAAPHYRRAYQLIIDDAAAIWLYEVTEAHAVHARLLTPPWRAEAWWRTIPLWRVDPAKRLPRDAAPVTP